MSKRTTYTYRAAESKPRQAFNDPTKSPRGVMALIVNPTLHDNSAFSTGAAPTHHLTFFGLNPTASRISIRKRRRKERFGGRDATHEFDIENQDLNTLGGVGVSGRKDQRERESGSGIGISRPAKFSPNASEFTLLYFYESNLVCKNSKRFTPILASFMNNIQHSSENGDNSYFIPCQLICVPNYDDEAERYSEPNILTHLSSEAYFWHLGVNHVNRLAIIR